MSGAAVPRCCVTCKNHTPSSTVLSTPSLFILLPQVLTIDYVTGNGWIVVFREPFRFHHYGGPEYQSEVALLSRSIVLQSEMQSEARLKGGHVKIMGQVGGQKHTSLLLLLLGCWQAAVPVCLHNRLRVWFSGLCSCFASV
jgi:hypothetical protein